MPHIYIHYFNAVFCTSFFKFFIFDIGDIVYLHIKAVLCITGGLRILLEVPKSYCFLALVCHKRVTNVENNWGILKGGGGGSFGLEELKVTKLFQILKAHNHLFWPITFYDLKVTFGYIGESPENFKSKYTQEVWVFRE